jgi:hypothetical protein
VSIEDVERIESIEDIEDITATATRMPGGTSTLAGRTVARIGFGAMQLAERRPGRPDVSREAAVAILRSAVASGVNHIDTADFYGTASATANDLIREALHPYPEHLVLATKVGAERDAGGALVPAQRPERLRAGVEANLARLGPSGWPWSTCAGWTPSPESSQRATSAWTSTVSWPSSRTCGTRARSTPSG